jgi:hypothetical protein
MVIRECCREPLVVVELLLTIHHVLSISPVTDATHAIP